MKEDLVPKDKARLRRIEVHPSFLMNTFTTGHTFKCVYGLPEDICFHGFQIDPKTSILHILVGHHSFTPIEVNKPVPIIDIQFKRLENE